MPVPFAETFPRTFSVRSIRSHAPAAPGIYGISNSRQWIFIDGADDIQEALLAHLSEPNGAVQAMAPTGFQFELCDAAMQPSRKNRLLLEYQPAANRRPG